MSVYAAIAAVSIKTPAGNGVLVHRQYIRELLDHNVLKAFVWTDARDMIADGFTKDSVDRAALHDVMDGRVRVQHAHKLWRPKTIPSSS